MKNTPYGTGSEKVLNNLTAKAASMVHFYLSINWKGKAKPSNELIFPDRS